MSEILKFNTEDYSTPKNDFADPWAHLDAAGWVQKQIDWANSSSPSGEGLTEHIQSLGENLIGIEIGVCLAATTEHLLLNCDNIKTLYAVDNYPAFTDWNGSVISQERQNLMKEYALSRLNQFGERANIQYKDSIEFSTFVEDDSIDFIFIDGDHSFDGAYRDLQLYYSKIKKGGIFAGHDYNLATVNLALNKFFGDKVNNIELLENNAWMIYKD